MILVAAATMLALVNPKPIDPNLFTDAAMSQLLGGRHRDSGRIVFPLPGDNEHYEPVPLAREGRLWSYTVQRFAPKSPPYAGAQPFEPFGVAYVELPGQVIVETRLADADTSRLRIGMPMRLTTVPLRTDPDGSTVCTYAFRPVNEGAP